MSDVAPLIYRCDRVRHNNGIVELFFSRRELFFSRREEEQDQHIIFNVGAATGDYREGDLYLVTMPVALPLNGALMSHHRAGNHVGGGSEERLLLIENALISLLEGQVRIMSTLQDMTDTLAVIDTKVAAVDTKVTAVGTDVDTLLAKLAAFPTAGLTPEQQAALDAAVVHAQGIATSIDAIGTSLASIDTKANPPVPVA